MLKPALFLAVSISTVLLPRAALSAQCQWTITGRLQVEDTETESDAKIRNLAGINVRVQASVLADGGFATWSTVHTNVQGEFSLTRTKNCSKRRFRVDVRFNNDELRVNKTASDEWMRVYSSSARRSSGTLNIGTQRFRDAASGVLGNRDNVRRATTWYMIKTLIDRFKDESTFVAFNKKIRIAYPANVISDVPYANGVDNTAYIHSEGDNDWWGVDVIVHEVMHLWNYQHNNGTSDWIGAALSGLSTHSFQEDPNIAFHEGFAEWAKNEIMYHVWGRDKVGPRSRYQLAFSQLTDLDVLERNDNGVQFALELLSAEDVYGLRFGSADRNTYGSFAGRVATPARCPESPDVSLWQLLGAFAADAEAGWPADWQVGNADYGIWRFFERAADILPNLSAQHTAMFTYLLDIAKTTEPSDSCSQ